LAPDLTDAQWLNVDGSYGSIAGLVRSGVPKPKEHSAPMPALGGAPLSGAQVCAVAAYVYSLGHR
jgi:mono/diheme cytochrome c family protein